MASEPIEVKRRERDRAAGGWSYSPPVDVYQTDEGITILADMPGASAESIDVRFEAGRLVLHGRVSGRAQPEQGMLLHEYGVGDYHREIELREPIEPDAIGAEYRDGVLCVQLPLAREARPRRIPVKPGREEKPAPGQTKQSKEQKR